MNKLGCLIIIFFTCGVCDAQNLVPNGDFESYVGCPNSQAQIDSCLFWFTPTTNVINISGTPDYFNQCSTSPVVGVPNNFSGYSYQYAHSGSAYAGVYIFFYTPNNYREYIEVQLTETLGSSVCYHFQMYINLPNACIYTSDDIGVYFSDTMVSGISNYYPLPFLPQINNANGNYPDTLNWTLVSGDYVAAGGENYLIIGNFKNDLNTDTVIANNTAQFAITYFYIDDVSLISCITGIEEQNSNSEVNIYPNPVTDKLNIAISNNELSEIILYDIASRKLLQQEFINSVAMNTHELAKGIYLYEVRNKNGVIKKGKVVKD